MNAAEAGHCTEVLTCPQEHEEDLQPLILKVGKVVRAHVFRLYITADVSDFH